MHPFLIFAHYFRAMDTEKLKEGYWYSAVYESGFKIIFKVATIDNGMATFCRKDGVEVDSIPAGYTSIVVNGCDEPEYE